MLTSLLRPHPTTGIRSVDELLQLPYFEVLACLTSTSLHPGGGAATQLLLDYCRLYPAARVLEVGCGPGWTTRALLKANVDVTVVERSQRMLDAMLFHCAQEEILFPRYNNVRIEDFVSPTGDENCFNLAILECVIGFVEDKVAMVNTLVRHLAPGGRIGVLDVHYVRDPSASVLEKMKAVTGHAIDPMTKRDWSSLFGNLDCTAFTEFQLPDTSADNGRLLVEASDIHKRIPCTSADLKKLERYLDEAGDVFRANKSYMQGHIAVWQVPDN